MSASHKKVPKTKETPAKEKIVFSGNDKIVHDLICAPSKDIDDITYNLILRDTGFVIEYLKQRINLEQKYLDDLCLMTSNIQQCCLPNEHNLIQMSFMNYVGLADTNKPSKQQYIDTLKAQCENLVKFRDEQQRHYDKNKAWMNQVNGDYLIARLKKLPTVHDIYVQKWDEIEKTNSCASPIPLTPSSTLTGSFPSFRALQDEEVDTRSMSLDDDRSKQGIKFHDPMNGNQQSSRIERFMKRRLNKPEDPGNKNIRLAKLKVEVAEADTNYRNVVREINTLAITVDATNLHILNNVQTSLKEKADKVKQMLQIALEAELQQSHQVQQPVHPLLDSVQRIDNEYEAKKFNKRSIFVLRDFKKPEPIYYQNHHVGICKDLIFGTSLTEYAQQKHRSPPLLITKCIEAIERLGGLEKEGIYRVSGKQSNIEKIKHAFELEEQAVIIGQNEVPEDVFSIASVIKIFLRELKTPLFPFKLTDRLVYSQIPDQELRLMNLLTRLLKLPPANYDTLKALVHHLSELQARVEKNKMTTGNLTLIFTPAIFQDLNHAQNSPGEWAKDCVLEDLIMNNQDIFANKDLHNNSAITGHIEYGFDHTDDTPDQPNRYAMTVQSPDSPTGTSHEGVENEYSFITTDEEDAKPIQDDISTTTSNTTLFVSNNFMPEPQQSPQLQHTKSRPSSPSPPQRSSSRSPSPQPTKELEDTGETEVETVTPSRSGSVERKKFQARFQGKGLKVDTGGISSSGSKGNNIDMHVPTVKSAVVPSYDWLNLDPETTPVVPKLRRSVTTGKKVLYRRKNSAHQMPEGGQIPSVPVMKRYHSNTTNSTSLPHNI